MKNFAKWAFNNPSVFLVLITGIICFIRVFQLAGYNNPSRALGWDGACYYSYLPAIIVHRDLSYAYTQNITDPESKKMVAYVTTPYGKFLPKTTCGVALMYLPFYLTAHAINASTNSGTIDGYEPVYLMCISVGAVIYAILALIILRKMLRIFFNDWVVTLSLISIFWGTNLYFYVIGDPYMSHVYSFFLISLLVYGSYKWYQTLRIHQCILMSILLGLLTLIRPTNIIYVLLPLLIGVNSWSSLKERIIFLLKRVNGLVLAFVFFLCIIGVQLVLWKIGTDSWFRFSYGKEGFFWAKPHLFDGLFSYRKGWLMYSPIMIFSIIGMFFFGKKLTSFKLSVWIIFVLNMYIVFSWWCWWYGGSYGMRALIDSYPLCLLAIVALVNKAWNMKNKVVIVFLVICIAYFVSSNIHQTRQYRITHIHHDSMTKEAFWAMYWKETPPPGYDKMLRKPDYEAAVLGVEEY